jgi:hypothetical protein
MSPLTTHELGDALASPADVALHVPSAVLSEKNAGTPEDLDGGVDWDVRIETPPPRPAGHVVVRFQQGGQRQPRIVDDIED